MSPDPADNRFARDPELAQLHEALTRPGGPFGLVASGQNLQGSVEGTYLSFEFNPSGGDPERYGIFWSDRGWLFLVRSSNAGEPGTFLKDYLAVVGR